MCWVYSSLFCSPLAAVVFNRCECCCSSSEKMGNFAFGYLKHPQKHKIMYNCYFTSVLSNSVKRCKIFWNKAQYRNFNNLGYIPYALHFVKELSCPCIAFKI